MARKPEVPPPVRSPSRPFVRLAAAAIASAILASGAEASFWPNGDWNGRDHTLKVCLNDPNNKCPAGMADSIKAAIGLWNDKNTTWRFSFTDDCDDADVKIECGRNSSLGTTYWNYNSRTNTSARVRIKDNADWGWCDDKYELVSTIAHELGHCCRLKDTPAANQSLCMRGRQNKAGHARGPAAADSREAATSDTAGAAAAARTNPPGGQDQAVYLGVITPEPTAPPFRLDEALFVDVRPLQPEFLTVIAAKAIGPEEILWQAIPNTGGPDMQLFYVQIVHPDGSSLHEGIFHVGDRPWDPSVGPHAVAPPDTTVPTDTSDVLLYTDRSFHDVPGEEMAFGWMLGPDVGVQSQGSVTSVNLPAGEHVIRLQAVDQFGHESEDLMRVMVLTKTGVDPSPTGALQLALAFQVPFTGPGPMPITLAIPVEGEPTLRVFDVQGRLVRTLLRGARTAGQHQVAWDLRDEAGRPVPTGVYLCTLQLGSSVLTRKIVFTP